MEWRTIHALLDSHHRFVPEWDKQVVAFYEERQRAGVAKPIITTYLPPYNPHNEPDGRTWCLLRIHLLERYENMLFRLGGCEIPKWQQLTAPVPAHFASLHFLFASGSFNQEIIFDPAIYFFADEVAIALRAYTSGYDLFHPHRVLGWHLYDRATRVTHWADHPEWEARHELSCHRLRELYQGRLHVAQELLRHSSCRTTLDIYTRRQKRATNLKVVELMLPLGTKKVQHRSAPSTEEGPPRRCRQSYV